MDNKKDIKKELQEITPFLADVEKKSGFKVPENYFKQLEDDLWDQLQPAKKEIAVSTPQPTWFDQLLNNIAILFQPQMALRLATVTLLIVGGLIVANQIGISDTATLSSNDIGEDISQEAAVQYIAAHLDDFDTESLMELELTDEELSLEELLNEEDINDILDNLDDRTLEDIL